MEKEKIHQIILALTSLKGLGRKTIYSFLMDNLSAFTDEDITVDWLTRKINELSETNARIKPVDEITVKNALSNAYRILEQQEEMSIFTISILDENYPENFKRLKNDAPLLLFAKGSLELLNNTNKYVGVIGSRQISDQIKRVGTRLAHILAEQGFIVVSGLAVGSDTCGHKGALETGYTIAIMPCGLDKVAPAENRQLFNEIIESGSLAISEYPIGRAPDKATYVERDRLQAGLSDGIAVLETSETGGTMHAVKKAFEIKSAIGCLSPDTVEQSGNRMLVREYDAHILNSQNDIDKFIELLNTKKLEAKPEKPVKKETVKIEQASLF